MKASQAVASSFTFQGKELIGIKTVGLDKCSYVQAYARFAMMTTPFNALLEASRRCNMLSRSRCTIWLDRLR
eukprot:IDg11985t1